MMVSHGSAATSVRCGGTCSKRFVANLQNSSVKEFWKSINISRSYAQKNFGVFFYASQCRRQDDWEMYEREKWTTVDEQHMWGIWNSKETSWRQMFVMCRSDGSQWPAKQQNTRRRRRRRRKFAASSPGFNCCSQPNYNNAGMFCTILGGHVPNIHFQLAGYIYSHFQHPIPTPNVEKATNWSQDITSILQACM